MNTPTPRTDAAWASSFEPCEYRAAHTARTMRECSQQLETELAALTAERDHWQKIAVSASHEREHNANVAQAMTAERDQLRTENATFRAAQKACEACDEPTAFEVRQLRAQLHALQLVCGTTDADKFSTWVDRANARAERAEAELASERARLDWIESDAGVDWQWSDVAGGIVSRAAIDAAMQEGAK